MTNGQTMSRRGLRLAAGLLAGATVLALAPAAGAATPPSGPLALAPADGPSAGRSDSAALQQALDAITTQAGATSAIAEVRENGKVAWRGTTGVRDLAGKAPAPVDGRFRAGSVTKTFLATVLLQLSAEGKVGLDDPIERYLPGVVPGGGAITVRQVLNHTAGIFDFGDLPEFAQDTEAQQEQFAATIRWQTFTPQQLIAAATSHPPYFAPGQGWHYSNTDYILIGEIIGKVTGHSWRTEVRQRILRPLGLDHTSLPGTATTIPGPHSHGYFPLTSGPADITDLNPSAAGAAGELISTTDDLTRFNAALMGGRLLAPAQLAEMTSTIPAIADPPSAYGLGLMATSLSCGAVWGHPGGIAGYSTFMFSDRAGTRQIAISLTQYDPVKSAALNQTVIGLMNQTFCAGTPGAAAPSGDRPLGTDL
ncbi:serine hydrolase domain-containing protein [Kitasatospora sp. MAP5-34]|uniref:serine hydrolase domain-containing protein n=1 Tax=Kitasatospora sp. MAP5-34 TaxID=3035102 RepID=UPI002474AF16|nr:serine hydrolase domain-containing protein [Kitasatospora sp. MAP5-34]MDH6575547.1 D-alanyl-D-alanine carboxypeptidase [Kitasatospora sp. MAP5-34]